MNLKVNEIYKTIQGESTFAGTPCGFVRLTGCNLRCSYCDTEYAYEKGEHLSIPEILDKVHHLNTGLICVTGGEPLCQADTPALVEKLLTKNYDVLVETNGTRDISKLTDGATVVMDIKCPGSGMSDHSRYANLEELNEKDEVKFVVTSRKDFDWAISKIKQYKLIEKQTVLISPAAGVLKVRKVADWILEEELNLRLQPQLHRLISEDGKVYR